MPLIEVQNLGKTYLLDDVSARVLHQVTFAIHKGEFVAIMGPSGSGKSTLLHLLGMLDRPSEGTYMFNDKSIEGFTNIELASLRNRSIGFVFQQFFLLPRMSVLDNVMLPLSYSQIPRNEWESRSRKVLESVGLGHRIEYLPTKLSGGERQRVAIARALVMEPDVLFADEPTGNLDSKSGAQVMELFERLHHEGRTVVLITHDEHIAQMTHRIIRIKDGTVVEDKTLRHASPA
jgi:putative ABC transport system ATP-binding protein